MHYLAKSKLGLLGQLLLDKLAHSSTGASIRLSKICSDPDLDILDLGKRIGRQLPARIERSEANAKTDVFDIPVLDESVGITGQRKRRVDEEFEEGVAGNGPAALVEARDKGLAVGKSVGERDDGGFTVCGTRQLLGVWDDDREVDGLEYTKGSQVSVRSGSTHVMRGRTYSC